MRTIEPAAVSNTYIYINTRSRYDEKVNHDDPTQRLMNTDWSGNSITARLTQVQHLVETTHFRLSAMQKNTGLTLFPDRRS